MEIKNRRGLFKYKIEQTYICGIELKGTEVKSVRLKMLDLTSSYVIITKRLEAMLNNMVIDPYDKTSPFVTNTKDRQRRLLLRKKEINKIFGLVHKTGKTIVPVKIFINSKNLVKLEIAVVSPLKLYDKRQQIKERDITRYQKKHAGDI